MSYVKVENGQIISTVLPITDILKNGKPVSGYNLLDEATLRSEGWLPLTENKPAFNNITQYLEFLSYTITENEVIANYIIKEIPVVPYTPTIDEQIEQLRLEQAQSNAELIDLMIALTGGMA
jgi:hypothetical protein